MSAAPAGPASLQVTQKAWLVDDAGRLLMVRYGTIGHGRWDLPGGRIDVAELDLDAALTRELREEAGVTATPAEVLDAYIAVHPATSLPALFLIRRAELVSRPAECSSAGQVPGDDIAALGWHPLSELAALDITPAIRARVLNNHGGDTPR